MLRNLDGRVRIWYIQHESMDPSGFISTVLTAAGGVMLCGIYSLHRLEHLGPINSHSNRATYLGIVAEHVPQVMFTVHRSSRGHFQLYSAAGIPNKKIVADRFMEHCNEFKLAGKSPDINLIEHRWDLVKREIRNL